MRRMDEDGRGVDSAGPGGAPDRDRERRAVNVSVPERWGSAVAGLALALHGLSRGGVPGVALALAGGSLVHRGVTGHCAVYGALGAGTAEATRSPVASVPHGQGVKVERTVTVHRDREEVYRFWRDFENLPRIMGHLEEVRVLRDRRSHWRAKAPLGRTVEWEAEVVEDVPNERVSWRSLPGADVRNAGSVRFVPAPRDLGTEIHVELRYELPAGRVAALAAKVLGEDPTQQVKDDLRRFKQVAELGEVVRSEGSPEGVHAARTRRQRPAQPLPEPETVQAVAGKTP
jgi:uncharacterized membrane protein